MGTSDCAIVCLFVVVVLWEHLYNNLQYITRIIMRLWRLHCNSSYCLLCPLLIDLVGRHAPHHLVLELDSSAPPPPAPLCSKAFPIAVKGKAGRKCDL